MTRSALASLLVALLALAACSDEAVEESPGLALDTVQPGALTACVALTPRLVEQDEQGALVGYDVEVLGHVADGLGVPLETVLVPFDELVSGVALNGLRCDVAAAGIVDDPAMDAVVRRSTPYRQVDRLLVTLPTGPEITDPTSWTGRVGVEAGGAAEDAVERLDAAEVVPFPSGADLRRALLTGGVDAVLVAPTDLPTLREEVPDAVVRTNVATDATTVVLYAQGADDALVAAVDEQLASVPGSALEERLTQVWLRG